MLHTFEILAKLRYGKKGFDLVTNTMCHCFFPPTHIFSKPHFTSPHLSQSYQASPYPSQLHLPHQRSMITTILLNLTLPHSNSPHWHHPTSVYSTQAHTTYKITQPTKDQTDNNFKEGWWQFNSFAWHSPSICTSTSFSIMITFLKKDTLLSKYPTILLGLLL